MAHLQQTRYRRAVALVIPAIGVRQVRRLRHVTVSALQVSTVAALRLQQIRQFVLLVTTVHQAQALQHYV